MRNTKYLFDENKMTADGCVSVSQLQTFLSCKRKWQYNYIENLKPRVERSYLTIGKLCHKGMQTAMQSMWQNNGWNAALSAGVQAMQKEYEEYCMVTPHLEEEIPEFEQLWKDAESVFRQAFEEFEPWKYEVVTIYDNERPIPALELHFRVPCPPTKGLHGYIDAILREKETQFVWCVDYKFRKSISPDEDEAFNIQNAVYAYACKKMGIGISGTMTWQHLNTPAVEPKKLGSTKNGVAFSRAKVKTTWKKYAECVAKAGGNPEDYQEEMIPKLSDIEWYRATLEYRNERTINQIWKECVVPVAKQIVSAHGKKANNFRSLYPWNCRIGCQYQSLCQAELRGYDADAIREREYTRRTTRNEGEATESALAPAT